MMDFSLRKNLDQSRYEAWVGQNLAGYADFKRNADGVVELPHTLVQPEYEGQGVGSALAEYAFNDVATLGGSVDPVCPFMATWAQRHPEYLRLVVTRPS